MWASSLSIATIDAPPVLGVTPIVLISTDHQQNFQLRPGASEVSANETKDLLAETQEPRMVFLH